MVVPTTPKITTKKPEVTSGHQVIHVDSVTTEGSGGYTVANQNNETKNTPQHMDEENTGIIAGVVIGALLLLIIVASVVSTIFVTYQ